MRYEVDLYQAELDLCAGGHTLGLQSQEKVFQRLRLGDELVLRELFAASVESETKFYSGRTFYVRYQKKNNLAQLVQIAPFQLAWK